VKIVLEHDAVLAAFLTYSF